MIMANSNLIVIADIVALECHIVCYDNDCHHVEITVAECWKRVISEYVFMVIDSDHVLRLAWWECRSNGVFFFVGIYT